MRLSCTRNEDHDYPAFNSFLFCLSDILVWMQVHHQFHVVTELFLVSSICQICAYFDTTIRPISLSKTSTQRILISVHFVKSSPNLVVSAKDFIIEHGSIRRRYNHHTYNYGDLTLFSSCFSRSRSSHATRTAGLQRVIARTGSMVTRVSNMRMTSPNICIYAYSPYYPTQPQKSHQRRGQGIYKTVLLPFMPLAWRCSPHPRRSPLDKSS